MIDVITPLREGRRKRPSPTLTAMYFNSRPCERGDLYEIDRRITDLLISIHAPARGATCLSWMAARRRLNFNSRPCERGDVVESFFTAFIKFQFTPLREGRQGLCHQSLHHQKDFNSRPCERGDAISRHISGTLKGFQFTPLREGRHTGK